MKKALFTFIVILSITNLNAQMNSKIGFGIQKDLFCNSLNIQNISVQATGVNIFFMPTNKFNFSLGYNNTILFHTDTKKYTPNNYFSIGLGYNFFDKTKNFSSELNFSFANSLNNFEHFANYHYSLGVNFFAFNTFFIGTGLRYSFNTLEATTLNSLNWYWQMGFKLNFRNISNKNN